MKAKHLVAIAGALLFSFLGGTVAFADGPDRIITSGPEIVAPNPTISTDNIGTVIVIPDLPSVVTGGLVVSPNPGNAGFGYLTSISDVPGTPTPDWVIN
jgi:hypothetical protein